MDPKSEPEAWPAGRTARTILFPQKATTTALQWPESRWAKCGRTIKLGWTIRLRFTRFAVGRVSHPFRSRRDKDPASGVTTTGGRVIRERVDCNQKLRRSCEANESRPRLPSEPRVCRHEGERRRLTTRLHRIVHRHGRLGAFLGLFLGSFVSCHDSLRLSGPAGR